MGLEVWPVLCLTLSQGSRTVCDSSRLFAKICWMNGQIILSVILMLSTDKHLMESSSPGQAHM